MRLSSRFITSSSVDDFLLAIFAVSTCIQPLSTKHDIVVFNVLLPIYITKCVFKHQDLDFFCLELNKYFIFPH